jgi:hypothetical protein
VGDSEAQEILQFNASCLPGSGCHCHEMHGPEEENSMNPEVEDKTPKLDGKKRAAVPKTSDHRKCKPKESEKEVPKVRVLRLGKLRRQKKRKNIQRFYCIRRWRHNKGLKVLMKEIRRKVKKVKEKLKKKLKKDSYDKRFRISPKAAALRQRRQEAKRRARIRKVRHCLVSPHPLVADKDVWKTKFSKCVWQLNVIHLQEKIVKVEKILNELVAQCPQEVLQGGSEVEQTSSVIMDSGAMRHSGDSENSDNKDSREELDDPLVVKGVNGTVKEVTHQFTLPVPSAVKGKKVMLSKAIDIPGTGHDLVSVGLLDDAGLRTVFENGEAIVTDKQNRIVMYAKKVNGLYRMRAKLIEQHPSEVVNWDMASLKHAHDVMGHKPFDVIRKMLNLPKESRESLNPVCAACIYAQCRNKKVPTQGLRRAPRYGYRLHSDTSCKMPATNYSGKQGVQRYVLTGDEFSDYLWVDFGQRKSDAKKIITRRVDKLNNEMSPENVVEHQTDGGTEFVNKWLEQELADRGVETRHSTPHCQYQNGWIESRMEEIQRTSRAFMFRGNAPESDYPYAVQHAVWLHNVLPNAVTGRSPFEKQCGIEPREKPKQLKGALFCECMAKLYVHGKQERDAIKCVYLGKDPKSPGHLVRVVGGKRTGKEVRAAVVIQFLDTFPYADKSVPVPDAIQSLNYNSDSEVEEDGVDVKDEPEPKVYSDEEEEESEDEREDNGLRKNLLNEPNEIREDVKEGSVPVKRWKGGQDAFEIEDIVAQKYVKGRKGKRIKYYQVKWKGDYPLDWLHCSRVRAPDIVREWNEKMKIKEEQTSSIENLFMQIDQLTGGVEIKPQKVVEEENPFKELFNPLFEKRIPPPKGYKEMLAHPFAKHYQEALLREKMENQKWNTYVEVPRDSVPAGVKIIRPVTAYDQKYNARGEIYKFKSRVCLDGSRTTVDPSETYEAIASTSTIRMLLCLATRFGLNIAQSDVVNFFLQAKLPEGKEYYAEIPDGWAENDPKTHVAKVLAPWYGLKESAKLAGDQLAAIMKSAGLKENPWMPKVFFKWEGDNFVACANHIDDSLWVYSSREMLDRIMDKIDKDFKMTRDYNPTKLLGFEIEYDAERGMRKLHQGTYNIAKLREMNFTDGKSATSPALTLPKVSNPIFEQKLPQAKPEAVRLFQKKVGVHMWGLQTDPSSMFVVHKL